MSVYRGVCESIPGEESERLGDSEIVDEPVELRTEADLHISLLHETRGGDIGRGSSARR